MPTWYPSSIIRQNDAEDFGRQSKLLVDDLGTKLQDANQQISGHIQSLLPSLESLMPWAQGWNENGPALAGTADTQPGLGYGSGVGGADLSQDPTTPLGRGGGGSARPSSALPSLESLSPWEPQVQVGPLLQNSQQNIPRNMPRPDEYNASPSAPVERGGELHAYARQAAERNGVDPNIFERQIQQESGFNPSAGSPAGAQGIAQIMPQYHPGVDTSDPYASLDYAAQLMGQHLKTYGGDYRKALQAYNAGPGAVASGAADSYGETNSYLSNILGGAEPIGKAQPGGNTTAPIGRAEQGATQQVDQAALDDPDKWSLCGPVAAVLAATKRGADWSVAQAKQLASSLGLWDPSTGMHGLASEVQLLQRLGIQANTGAADQQRLAQDAQNGNTPIVSTDGHYFVLSGYDPDTQKFDTGTTGTLYKGGSRWLSLADMQALAGTIQGAAYIDNPASSTPGSVASPTVDTSRGQNTPVAGLDTPDRRSGVQFSSQLQIPDPSSTDSTYGPFDPPGYGQSPVPANADPSDFPATPPTNPLPYGPAQQDNPDQPSGLSQKPISSVTPTFTPADLLTGNTSNGTVDPGALLRPGGDLAQAVRPHAPIWQLTDLDRQIQDAEDAGDTQLADELRSQQGAIMQNIALGAAGNPAEAVGGMGRFYHGTGRAFGRPNPTQFDENGLFGPGYYLTSDPRVAGSYSEARAPQLSDEAYANLQARVEQLQGAAPGSADAFRLQNNAQLLADETARRQSGPNVRAVDVPAGLNTFPIDGPLSSSQLRELLPVVRGTGAEEMVQDAVRQGWGGINGSDVYDAILRRADGDKTMANDLLKQAGYDGITYSGGKRIPMQDAAGQNIEHQAVMIFGDSLPKVTNAISGQQGGLNVDPAVGGYAARGVAGAAAGGTSVYYAPPTDEQGNPLDPSDPRYQDEQRRRIALGAAGGLATGLHPRLGRPVAGNIQQPIGPTTPGGPIRATGLSDPNNQKLAQMFSKPVPSPATTTPWYRRLAQGLTDDRAVLSGWENEIRARLGPNTPATDTISDLTRLNPDSVATQRLKPIEEAASTIRAVGVDPDVLSVYLAHTHDLDIADSFGMRAWDAAIAKGATPAQAQAAYDAAANGRTFSGGRHVPDIKASLQSLSADLGPSRLQAVQDAAQRIWDLNGETRDRLFAAGGMDQATHADLSARYPHYVTTDIVNHIDPESSVAGTGGGVSQRTNAIRELSAAGTAADRLDPLQSVVANTIRSERWIAKNTVFQAFHELVTADPALATQLGITPSKPGGTKEVTGLINGQRETLRVDRPIAEVIEMGNNTALGILGEAFKALTGPFKAGLTTFSAGFQYVVNPLRDSTDFFTRQSAYLGGPQHLPEVMAAYGAAIKDVAAEGKWTQAYKAAGGSYERLDTSARGIANLTRDLTASGGEQLTDPRKIAFIARDVLTLGARPFGERAEMVPRVAAFKMAAERGSSPVESMIAGRNATIPFEVGGRWIKAVNTAVPFMNATVQAGAQLGRSFRDHPVATTASMAAIVGLPALAAQGWNRSDPARAAAYADVPDYLKRNGLIFMLPLAGSDSRGSLPNYVWIPLGTFAPAATAVNAAVEAKMGESSPDEFGKLLMGTLGSFSPIKGDSVGSALASVIPPGISTARDLMANRDNFRGRTIASDAADRNAGALAKGITGGLQAIGEHVPPVAGLRDIRPSQTEYVIRDLAGAPGQIASAAANMGAGQQTGRTRPVQDVPVLGGLAGRIVRDTGGQQLQNAQDVRVSPEVDSALRSAGLRPNDVITTVPAVAKGIPLNRDEQRQYQELTTAYTNDAVTRAATSPLWTLRPAQQEQMLRDAIEAARGKAADEVLRNISAIDRKDRINAEVQRRGG